MQFNSINNIAAYLREAKRKKQVILFAHNGTGKTRLSMEFRGIGKATQSRDTLYFNAYTEDLFIWVNDLKNDKKRYLKFKKSHFFDGIDNDNFKMKLKILVSKFIDINFEIYTAKRQIHFFHNPNNIDQSENIKISRGEERIFIFCFFLAILQLVADNNTAYQWVKFIYIDDPISSLDDERSVEIGEVLAEIIRNIPIKTIMSTHHGLFFNVICNEYKNAEKYYLNKKEDVYSLNPINDIPFFEHLANLQLLKQSVKSGNIHHFHFNMFRVILEKTTAFLGYKKIDDCLNDVAMTRLLNIHSHGAHSITNPFEIDNHSKELFKKSLNKFIRQFKFNPEIFK